MWNIAKNSDGTYTIEQRDIKHGLKGYVLCAQRVYDIDKRNDSSTHATTDQLKSGEFIGLEGFDNLLMDGTDACRIRLSRSSQLLCLSLELNDFLVEKKEPLPTYLERKGINNPCQSS